MIDDDTEGGVAPDEQIRFVEMCGATVEFDPSRVVRGRGWRVTNDEHRVGFGRTLHEALMACGYAPGRRPAQQESREVHALREHAAILDALRTEEWGRDATLQALTDAALVLRRAACKMDGYAQATAERPAGVRLTKDEQHIVHTSLRRSVEVLATAKQPAADEFCAKCGALFGYQSDLPADAPTWSCSRCGAKFLARAPLPPVAAAEQRCDEHDGSLRDCLDKRHYDPIPAGEQNQSSPTETMYGGAYELHATDHGVIVATKYVDDVPCWTLEEARACIERHAQMVRDHSPGGQGRIR